MRSPYSRRTALLKVLLPLYAVALLASGWQVHAWNQVWSDSLADRMKLAAARLDAQLASAGDDVSAEQLSEWISTLVPGNELTLEILDEHGQPWFRKGSNPASYGGLDSAPASRHGPVLNAGQLRRVHRGDDAIFKTVDPATRKKVWQLTVKRAVSPRSNSNFAGGHFVHVTARPTIFAKTVYLTVGLLAAASIAVAILAVWIVRLWDHLLQPAIPFAEALGDIGAGKFRKRVPLVNTPVEWRKLSDAFDDMRSVLDVREQELRDDTEQIEAVLSSMNEGVLATDHAGVVTMANEAACDMLTINKRTSLNRSLIEIVRIPEITSAIERVRQSRKRTECEFETRSEPRRIIKARLTLPAGQEPPGVAIVMHDVTGLRQLETMRRDFVANVSHELKTPLASIRAYAETLRLGALNDAERNVEFVEQIETQAGVLEQQIQDLLQLARVESDASVFEITDVDVNRICQESSQQFRKVAQNRNLLLVLELEHESLKVRADAESIKTILTNLLSNAIHYTPEGGTIILRSQHVEVGGEEAANRCFVQLDVIDTGIGIAREQQQRVFERFYRVDKARSREMGGTGLGLSIVKHLTNAFDGTVELESHIGKGSRFSVRFPAAS